jgi:hypothetical protein
MKAICFHCHFVAVNYDQADCPQCSYPLIKSAGSVRLQTSQITEAFSMADMRSSAPVLPGIIQKEVRTRKRVVPQEPAQLAKGSQAGRLPQPPAPTPAPAAVVALEQAPRLGRRLLLVGEIMSGILLAGLVITLLGLWTG